MNIFQSLSNAFTLIGQKFLQKKNKINYELNKEIDTGDTWIDDKPIYFKIYELTNITSLTTSNVVIKSDVTDIDFIINFKLLYEQNNRHLNFSSRVDYIEMDIESNVIKLCMSSAWSNLVNPPLLLIWYIKRTI